MSTTTTTPIVEWTCIRHGNLESWYRPGGYGLIAVVTGGGTRWTWRVYDQNSGVLIDRRSPIRYRLRREQTLAQAKTYALRMLTGHERRWRRSAARRISAWKTCSIETR